MALSPGEQLGPYQIQSALGAGGMGEVYRARDTRLDRTVAIKVLSSGLAASPELLARFEREARAIAALQDSHICVLHDIGRHQDQPYLVMEYLEGETLAARLQRGRLPLGELARIGAAIAAALDRAHRAGIVHRDLKPGNVMLTASGAKLLDFGLAKAAAVPSAAASAPPSFTATLGPTVLQSPMTQAGAVLGTVQYMSPEQIEGREADARSDIFALGCVLYEMASAQRAFGGNTNLSVAAAILEKEPAPLRDLQPPLPAALAHLIEVCLRKSPDARWQSAADVRSELEWIATSASEAATEAAGAAPPLPPRRPWWLLLGVAAVAAALAAGAVVWLRPPTAPMALVAALPAPGGAHFNFGGSNPGPPAISPDGRQVVFAAVGASGRSDLWIRALDQSQPHELTGTDDAIFPFWSPDGKSIGYFTSPVNSEGRDQLIVRGLANGDSRALCDAPNGRGGTWSADGTILFAPDVGSAIVRIPASGGVPTPVTKLDRGQLQSDRFPYFLPDGKHFLYLVVNPSDENTAMLYWASLDGRQSRPLLHSTTGGIYASGHLLYSAQGTLLAQAFDPSTGVLSGAAVPVATGLDDDSTTWRPAYSVSRDGMLVYAAGSPGPEQVAWVDRSGKVGGALPSFAGNIIAAAVDPAGQRLALSLDQGLVDIWTVSLASGARARLTFGQAVNANPVWSPDGTAIAYMAQTTAGMQIFRRPAGGGAAQPIAGSAATVSYPAGWSADGRQLLAVMGTEDQVRLVALPAAGSAPVRVVLPFTSDNVTYPALSPDGRWASYLSGNLGQLPQLYVVPFQGGGGKWQVSTQGVTAYFWNRNGTELDLVDGAGQLQAIPVSTANGTPIFGAPRLLADHFPFALAATPDLQRFLAEFHPNDQQRLMVVTHWAGALH